MFYEDRLMAAIRRYVADDVMIALRDAEPMTLMYPVKKVIVPLCATVQAAWDKDLARFVIDARVKNTNNDEWLNGRSIFSDRELSKAKDRASLIEYCFDMAKKEMLDALANGEFDRIIKKAKES